MKNPKLSRENIVALCAVINTFIGIIRFAGYAREHHQNLFNNKIDSIEQIESSLKHD